MDSSNNNIRFFSKTGITSGDNFIVNDWEKERLQIHKKR